MQVEELSIEELISKSVKAAIKEFVKEQQIEKKKKALHNTKMLLKNYKKIKSSIENSISEKNQLEQDYFVSDSEEEVYINSIRKNKLKSVIIICHIDKALDITKSECIRKGTPEKYDAFVSCFIENMNYEEAAEQYFTSKQSISRWVNDVTRAISIQLFGLEGLELI